MTGQSKNGKAWLLASRKWLLSGMALGLVAQALSGIWSFSSWQCALALGLAVLFLFIAFYPRGSVQAAGLPTLPRVRRAWLSPRTLATVTAWRTIAAMFGVLTLMATGLHALHEVLLWRHGRLVEAQVINNERGSQVPIGGGAIEYAYRIGKVAYTGTVEVDQSRYHALRMGAFLPVTYLPGNPHIHRVGVVRGIEVAWNLLNTMLLISLAFLVLYDVLLAYERIARSQLRLVRTGVECIGVISHCKAVRRHDEVVAYQVHYSVKLPGGISSGTAVVLPVTGEPTMVGFPVRLFCDPNKLHNHLPIAAVRMAHFELPPLTPAPDGASLSRNRVE